MLIEYIRCPEGRAKTEMYLDYDKFLEQDTDLQELTHYL